jgi:hypothetical protein
MVTKVREEHGNLGVIWTEFYFSVGMIMLYNKTHIFCDFSLHSLTHLLPELTRVDFMKLCKIVSIDLIWSKYSYTHII